MHNKVNVLNAAELYTYKWLDIEFYVMCVLPQFFKLRRKEKRKKSLLAGFHLRASMA